MWRQQLLWVIFFPSAAVRSYSEMEREERMAPLDLKEVLVKFDGLAFVFPTFNLGFLKSFNFSFFFLLLEPIVSVDFWL